MSNQEFKEYRYGERQKPKMIFDESEYRKEVLQQCKEHQGKPHHLLTTKERLYLDSISSVKTQNGFGSSDGGFISSHFYNDTRFEKQEQYDFYMKTGATDKWGNPVLKQISGIDYEGKVFMTGAKAKAEYMASGDHLWKDGYEVKPFEPVVYNDDRMTKEDFSKLWIVFIILLVLSILYKNYCM